MQGPMENPLEKIAIRPFVLGDIPRLYDAIIESMESLSAWMPWCHPGYTIADTQNWVRTQTAAFARGDEYAFAVIDGHDRLVGGCTIKQVVRTDRYANIGYWTRLSCIGKGVATKAVMLAVAWAFANTDLHRLEILAAVENTASRRVAEKAGARFEGILPGRLWLQDRMHDAAMYVYLRS
jgi:RimJ/RimL family protein N-acetyltransferase